MQCSKAGLAVRVDQRSLAKRRSSIVGADAVNSQKVRYAECKPEYPVSAQVS